MDAKITLEQWARFCDGLKEAGRDILRTADGQDEVAQAEGLRYVTRLLRSGIERLVENWDPLEPFMAVVYNERLKWGLDNPDSIYSMSAVDGRYEYELSGNVGTVRYFNLTSAETRNDARQVTTGFLDGSKVKTDAEGNFRIAIGGPERKDNWLPLAPASNTVMLRQTFGDRSAEKEISCRIRLVTDVGPARPLRLDQMGDRTQKAVRFVADTGRTFLGLADMLRKEVNRLPAVSESLMVAMGGDPNYFYYWSAFRVQPDEALLLHLPEVPECDNWGLCLYNYWLESLDYSRSKINLNKFTSVANPDGSVTIVIAHQPPGGGNWLDVQGHVDGNMMFRWTGAKKNVAPRPALMRLNQIDWPRMLRRWDD